MPRPCQKRRASAAANRKSKSTKPEGPPPIRHKARQKAIHNARRGRGGGRGGRGGQRGGRGGQQQNSGDRFSQNQRRRAEEGELDFRPLSGANNFEVLHQSRSDYDMENREDGELSTDMSDDSDSDMDSDSEGDSDELDDEDISINIEEQCFPAKISKTKTPRPTIMFTVPAAVAVYDKMYLSRFPLTTLAFRTHYGLFQEDVTPDSGAYISLGSSAASRRSSVSSATSDGSVVVEQVTATVSETYNPARDYVFDWGVHSGKRFTEVEDKYLRTIGGQLYRYTDKHPGLREAFEYHRPGQARLSAPPPQSKHTQAHRPQQAKAKHSSQRPSRSEKYRFHKGVHEGKRLCDVPENYIRTLEGNPQVRDHWPGLREALKDFNAKTGRRSVA
ncbi:hypothetical protein ACJQWK_10272 [Exserohilum turcicum]